MRGTNVEERVAREALFGSLPILSNERLYGFVDALLLGIGEQAVQGLRRNVATDPVIE